LSDLAQRGRDFREWTYGKLLPSGVGLFEPGVPEDVTGPLDFVMRVNRQVFVQGILRTQSKRCDPAKAITAGRLGSHAELVAFGTWMVCDGMPGATKHPGPAPDVCRLLKVTACGFAAMNAADRLPKGLGRNVKRVTTKDIATFWEKIFGDAKATSAYSSNKRSLGHILPDYLGCVNAGTISFNGQTVTASPMLKRLEKAINMPVAANGATAAPGVVMPAGALSAPTAAPLGGATTLPVSVSTPFVVPPTFTIPLVYSSPGEQARYRGTVPLPHADPVLKYSVEPLSATSKNHSLRADLVDRLVFRPALDLAAMVRVEALIDRIAVTVSTKRKTSYGDLKRAISTAGVNVYVADRTIDRTLKSYHACLPKVDMIQPTGKHFALTVQEPTPSNLRAVLDTIKDLAGIEGDVRPVLLELAVDFRPHPSLAPGDALLAREQIVGLVQRHHWSAGDGFDVPEGSKPRYVDARQVYLEDGEKKTRRLFSHGGDISSDRDLHEENVRQRLLSPDPGNVLYLDATIYRGNEVGKRRINNQHKIGDKRNSAKNTFINLPDEQRRARIEITLTSFEALEQAGLRTVDDLNGYNFRTLRRDFLVLRLPTCAPEAEDVERTIAQMTTRGVYSVELSQRARCLDERAQKKKKPRKTARDLTGQLVDWPEMNNKIGSALDGLRKKWRKF